ncbi:MAG TPA: glycerophosphodiester phosphodiesterase [Clostridiaceae bacterium]|nr:glycerophosphodiester phosphodiesterase [Clostridiaceae bacterium]
MKTKIFAHRGNAILEPENTLDAFQSALDLNVEGIELDIQKTQDGKIIVTHDENLQRVTNVDLEICKASYDQIKPLNAASFMNNNRNSYVPLLTEVLDLVKEKDVYLNIELKNAQVLYPELEEDVLDLVREFNLEERIIFSSFNHYSIMKFRLLGTNAELAFLYMEGLFKPWKYAKKNHIHGLHPFFPNLIIPKYVKSCHKKNIKVRPWTVDDPQQMSQIIALGVDGLITNDPKTALEIRDDINNFKN